MGEDGEQTVAENDIKTGDKWEAYCVDCEEIVGSHESGTLAEARAKGHIMENPDHEARLGKRYKAVEDE